MASNGDAVLDGGRERALGREAIVHREHGAARAERELAADDVVRVEVADGPAAAMEEHERRQDLIGHRAIHAHGDLFRGNQQPHLGDLRRFGGENRAGIAVDPARDERRHGVIRRQRRARDALEQRRGLRMQTHFTAASIFFSRSTKNGAHFIMRVSCVSISGRVLTR